MKRVILQRVYLPTETLGSIYDGNILLAKSMELPWKDNQSNISCIPEGIYIVHKMMAEPRRNYNYFRFEFVKGRNIDKITGWSRILMHKITYVKDLLGCIGIGGAFKDLNGDQVPDMIDSTKALEKLWNYLPDVFELEILKKQ